MLIKDNWKYRAGDLVAGFTIGAFVVLTHDLFMPRSLGLLGELVLGKVIGMTAQMLLSILLGGLLGSMEMMIPGMFAGMLAMVPALLPLHVLGTKMIFGGALGSLVFLVFAVWDERLKGTCQSVSLPAGANLQPLRPTIQIAASDLCSAAGTGDSRTSFRWSAARLYDALERAGSHRRSQYQRELFQKMEGKILFGAVGSGLNFSNFPPGKDIVAVDLSKDMLAAARSRAARYQGIVALQVADLQHLPFANESFDTVATASTLCSVSDSLQALREFHRVLKPGGRLLLFEHVRSCNPVLGAELDFMNFVLGFLGSAMNRDTVKHVQQSAFLIDRVVCAYLDIFLAIEAHKPDPASARVNTSTVLLEVSGEAKRLRSAQGPTTTFRFFFRTARIASAVHLSVLQSQRNHKCFRSDANARLCLPGTGEPEAKRKFRIKCSSFKGRTNCEISDKSRRTARGRAPG